MLLMFLFLLVFALDTLYWWSPFFRLGPHIRFTVSALNTIFHLLILLCPWMAFSLALNSPAFSRRLTRILFIGALVPVMLATIPFAIGDLLFGGGSELVSTASIDGYRIALYRLNCGAPCDFSIAVDQERTLIFPVEIARNLYVFDPAAEARCEIIGKDELRVTSLPYNEYPGETRIFHLKPFF